MKNISLLALILARCSRYVFIDLPIYLWGEKRDTFEVLLKSEREASNFN